jgi:hypothetical protein
LLKKYEKLTDRRYDSSRSLWRLFRGEAGEFKVSGGSKKAFG